MNRIFKALIVSLILPMAACSTMPINGRLTAPLMAEKIATSPVNTPFAISPDNRIAALNKAGLTLWHISSADEVPLSPEKAVAVAWSPLGYSLAAVFTGTTESKIIIFNQHGIKISEAPVDASLTELCWRNEDELVATGFRTKSYKFGVSYQSLLYHWSPGRSTLTETTLHEATLQKQVYDLYRAAIERGPMASFAPEAELMLYLQPIAPPMFKHYYKLLLRDLATGTEIELATAELKSFGAKISADGELLVRSEGNGFVTLSNPWSMKQILRVQSNGENLAISPSGPEFISDGRLFTADGKITELAESLVATFSADGKNAFASAGGAFYLLSGLNSSSAAKNEIRPDLRKMRMTGEISATEYLQRLKPRQ